MLVACLISAFLKQPEWWLVIFAFVTACIVSWQSFESKRAAEAAKEAAIAAKEQAKHIVASERPWILIEIELVHNGEYPVITCRAVNHGKTPAEIVDALARFRLTSPEENLSAKPEDEYRKGLGLPRDTPHHAWIAPSKNFGVFQYDTSLLNTLDPGCWKDVLGGKVQLYFLGYVRYKDPFSDDLHESGFCYRYGYSPKGEPGLYMAGPAGYN